MRPFERSQTCSRKGWPNTFFPGSLFAAAGLIAALLALMPTSAAAVVRITNDPGGNIGDYYSRFEAVRSSKDQVVIDGTCSSACTMILGIVPANRICVTRNALLGFHAAWPPNLVGQKVI